MGGWLGKFFKREPRVPAPPPEKPPAVKEEKVKTPALPPVVGATVSFDSFRRLQLRDTSPSDLESVIQHEKTLKAMESPKEHDWGMIFFGAGMFIFIVVIALKVLSEVDLSKLLG